MSADFQNKIDIEPILDKINSVIRKELNKVLYNNVVKNLSAELRKCQKELEEARKYYQQTSAEVSDDDVDAEEHILLNIEDISDSDSETSIVHLLNNVKVCDTNTQIKNVIMTKPHAEEDEEALEEEEEEEDTSEAAEEEEEEDTSEAAEEEEEKEAEEEVSTQAVNNTIVEEDDIETEESDLEKEEEEEEEEEEEDEEDEEEEEEEEEKEDEEEVFEIEIDDVTYYATSEENGPLYEVDEYGEPGKQVGSLKDGEPTFFSESAK